MMVTIGLLCATRLTSSDVGLMRMLPAARNPVLKLTTLSVRSQKTLVIPIRVSSRVSWSTRLPKKGFASSNTERVTRCDDPVAIARAMGSSWYPSSLAARSTRSRR